LRGFFDFVTNNGTLSSDDKDKLIEEGRNAGIDEDEFANYIDRWLEENGVTEAVKTSSAASGPSFDKFLNLTYYEILGVPESATQTQIEEKYKEKHKEYINKRDKKRADGEWAIITAAYNRLRDPIERKKYDRELHNPHPPGTPVLMVVRDPEYVFKNVKKGIIESVRILIKNPGGGLLQGTITSDATWLEPDRNKLLDIHEQELYINVITSKIPPRTYKVDGNITIDTNAGKEIIPFEVFLESYDDELLRLKQFYVPMLAALGGLIFSFHYQMLGLVIAGISLWLIGIVLAKPLLNLILNQGINLGRIPKPAIRVVSIGIVVLAVWLQYNSSQVVYKQKVGEKVSPPVKTAAVPTQKSKPAQKGKENRKEIIEREIDEVGLLIDKGDYNQADKRLSNLNKQYPPDVSKENIDNIHKKLSVEYRVTLDQKLNKAIDKDSFSLDGIVTEKQPQEGSGVFWGFNFITNDGIEFWVQRIYSSTIPIRWSKY